jgi:hypothetical protein
MRSGQLKLKFQILLTKLRVLNARISNNQNPDTILEYYNNIVCSLKMDFGDCIYDDVDDESTLFGSFLL